VWPRTNILIFAAATSGSTFVSAANVTAADDEERRNLGMREEPIRKRINFAERAQSSHADALQSELLVLEQYKKWRCGGGYFAPSPTKSMVCGKPNSGKRRISNRPTLNKRRGAIPVREVESRRLCGFCAGQNKNSIRMRG